MEVSYVVIGIVIYMVIAVGVAILARRSDITNMSGYFIGGRKMGGVISALSYSATTFSAFMLVGLAGLTYKGGVGALGFEIVYITGVSLVALFGPRFWLAGKKYGYVTPSEMIGDRFDSKASAAVIALVSCLFLIPYSAVQLAGVGYYEQWNFIYDRGTYCDNYSNFIFKHCWNTFGDVDRCTSSVSHDY